MSTSAHGIPIPRAEQPRAHLRIVREPEPLIRIRSYAEVQRDAILYRIRREQLQHAGMFIVVAVIAAVAAFGWLSP